MINSLSAVPRSDRQGPDVGQLYRELRAQHTDVELMPAFFARLSALLIDAEKHAATDPVEGGRP